MCSIEVIGADDRCTNFDVLHMHMHVCIHYESLRARYQIRGGSAWSKVN